MLLGVVERKREKGRVTETERVEKENESGRVERVRETHERVKRMSES